MQALNLTSGGDNTTTGTSKTTASISPSANALIICAVHNHKPGGGNPATVTVSGCNLTWVQIATFLGTTDNSHRITLFRAMGQNPTTGALTISSGENDGEWFWDVTQFTGTNTDGTNGSGAVKQSATKEEDTPATSTSISMGAFENSRNATYGFVKVNNASITKGANFTQLSSPTDNGQGSMAEWANTNQATVNWTFAGGPSWGMAIEIKAADTQDDDYAEFL